MFSKSTWLVQVRLVLVSLVWGGTFVAGRGLSHDISPVGAAFFRFAIASAALGGIMLLWRVKCPPLSGRHLMRVTILGFFGIFVYNLCFFEGLRYIPASRASLIVALNPALIALSAFLFMGERLNATRVIGIVAGFVGVAIIVTSRAPGDVAVTADATWRGDIAIFGCVLSWVTYTVFGRPVIRDLGPLATVFYSVLSGTALLFAYALASGSLGGSYSAHDWLSLSYLGVLGSAVAYVWYYDGVNQIGATRAGVFIALNPVFGVILGALFLNEALTLPMPGGGGFAVLGVYLCNRPTMASRVASRPEPARGV